MKCKNCGFSVRDEEAGDGCGVCGFGASETIETKCRVCNRDNTEADMHDCARCGGCFCAEHTTIMNDRRLCESCEIKLIEKNRLVSQARELIAHGGQMVVAGTKIKKGL